MGNVLLFMFVLLGLSYIPFAGGDLYVGHFVHKALPILLLLGVVLFKLVKTRQATYVFIALALSFSASGDMLIEFSFLHGLIAFAFAQFCYSTGFFCFRSPTKHSMPLAVLLGIVFTLAIILVAPTAGELKIAVACYIASLGLMTLTAAYTLAATRWIMVGALTFTVSDGLIGLTEFVTPIPYSSQWIMLTYYAAQLFIVKGFLEIAVEYPTRQTPAHVHQ
ncbi:lysoplasmalogenase [Aestuariibacter sp. AA17]|uniref:Lysoplasmalogenase n=1 Tax=Fluctibacter corallii TaxID=2984329 RepID=A0ABT3A7I4_9ALTE|nr:lysoplasmalogenase [Aestuariibacter sp. AA17]MCV2884635.1 lysoplasmalogenase [Aestuariibacter sp. AA17]